ncbi:hypothetical protein D0U04_07015 [Bacillus clarus]|uniref:Secreted protein n=1 Tax=Bacillus clarus TaxID=2338372 RepID=A0ABX9KZ56_9BACI|nr:hypothetical protein D0U04_07015 [Bacillus clarus]
MPYYRFTYWFSITACEVLFFSPLTTTTENFAGLIRPLSFHLPRMLLAQRRAKAPLNNGIIQSLPSAGFGFLIMPPI